MDSALTAQHVLDAVGGATNIATNSICMTRLRLQLHDSSTVDDDAITSLHGVLGVSHRACDGLDVVFGPNAVVAVAHDFAKLTGLPIDDPSVDAPTVFMGAHAAGSGMQINQPSTVESTSEFDDILSTLQGLDEADDATTDKAAKAKSLLVINGPNINMLGIREPGIYGREDFKALIALCERTGREAGFSSTTCYQSNHEGDLVDCIQHAYGVHDGIVFNPGAYTHTSVAILDAVKAVGIPCIEVHISKVSEREDFRQVSYIRQACFETISGLGIEGYAKAIRDMADHLANV